MKSTARINRENGIPIAAAGLVEGTPHRHPSIVNEPSDLTPTHFKCALDRDPALVLMCDVGQLKSCGWEVPFDQPPCHLVTANTKNRFRSTCELLDTGPPNPVRPSGHSCEASPTS